jgi:hypothetical protein
MLYNQPYGLPPETILYGTPYVNGNPSAGLAGSIPPAASVEYDQREIVAVIQWAFDHGYYDYAAQLCHAPTNADLTQLLKAIFGIFNSRLLTASRDYYVDAASGSDSNDGLSAAKPFLTLQKAQNTLVQFNLNGFNVQVHVNPGTYAPLYCGSIGGFGSIKYIGNTTTPSLCTISAPSGAAVTAVGTGDYQFNGFKVTSLGRTPGFPSTGFYAWGTAGITLYSVEFGSVLDDHMYALNGGYIGVEGPLRVTGTAGRAHAEAQLGGRILHDILNSPSLNITGPFTMQWWAMAGPQASMQFKYSTITGFANITGTKYFASTNGIIDSQGGGVSYLPGTVAGSVASGGQYT